MFGSAVSIVGLCLILGYVDNVTARTLLQSHDSVKLIGNERIDLSVQVLRRHKREAPSRSCLRIITVRNDLHPNTICRHDRNSCRSVDISLRSKYLLSARTFVIIV